MAGQISAVAGAALIILVVVADVTATLLVSQAGAGWWRPSRVFYAFTWRIWRFTAGRLPAAAREAVLSVYGPLSLLALLIAWLAGLLAGWALIYFSLNGFTLKAADSVTHDMASLVYFYSAALYTVLLFVAYLPGVFAAYNRRESRLLSLDDPAGRRVTPVTLLTSNAPDGDLGRLCDFFAGWEQWCADVLESHLAYPALNYFRSRHAGQSWTGALAALLDAAALACAVIPGAEEREPLFMFRRGRRTVSELGAQLKLRTTPRSDSLERDRLRIAYSRLVAASIPARDFEDSWRRLQALRKEYIDRLEALLEFLSLPPTFWGRPGEAGGETLRAAR